MTEFQRELEHLINKHSLENESNTPDYVLAEYLRGCLTNFAATIRLRDTWFGFVPYGDTETKKMP